MISSSPTKRAPGSVSNVPWAPTHPRFTVLDNLQRPIPGLTRIQGRVHAATTTSNASATVTSNASQNMANRGTADAANAEKDQMMQAQIKLNAELLQRIEQLEAGKLKTMADAELLQTSLDRAKKECAFYKAQFESKVAQLNHQKRKADENKENMSNNHSFSKTFNFKPFIFNPIHFHFHSFLNPFILKRFQSI